MADSNYAVSSQHARLFSAFVHLLRLLVLSMPQHLLQSTIRLRSTIGRAYQTCAIVTIDTDAITDSVLHIRVCVSAR